VTPRPDQIASGAAHAPPQASIPNPTPVAPPGPIQPQSFTVPAASVARPACLIANNRVQYLSLPDVDGGVWDFAQHRGRLVLLDFWGSWCGPCMRAIPKLVELQSHYRDGGLEVIGVACEQGPPAGYARKVRDARQRLPSINYRLVLADEYGRCPVQSQFRITQYPTLVLLDGDGTILWRGGAEKVHELEQILRRRLAN
jgi:thiol-disulfide isomerase/thioredoxin